MHFIGGLLIKHGRYADVRVDFAFKKCLRNEENKEATIGLLNSIIADAHIADVSFITTELPGSAEFFFFFDLKDFRKDEDELADDTEKWLYLLRNCRELKEMPSCFKGHAFDVFISAAELALQFAEEKGIAKGIEQGRLDIARNMLSAGMSKSDIQKFTGLTVEDVERL